jgi:hypothetical protein
MFRFNGIQIVLFTESDVENSMSLTDGTLCRSPCEDLSTKLCAYTLRNKITRSYSRDKFTCQSSLISLNMAAVGVMWLL